MQRAHDGFERGAAGGLGLRLGDQLVDELLDVLHVEVETVRQRCERKPATMCAMRWIVVLASLVACSKDAGPSPSPLVGKTRALADKICACRDAACLEPLDRAWNELAKDQPERQLSAEDVEALAAETQRTAKCTAELRK